MKAREVTRRIEALGGEHVRTRGSHRFYRVGGCQTTVAGNPGHDIATGTLHKIERDLEPVLGKGWLIRR